ncbi:MAG: threonine/serine exporter family protein [Firmicutes bacterium]|nr:threonine/serine exporter family protein [Bacillota bacterium]MDY3092344.1 threonine/serine exporter family protein [Erysipelotrichaceae bacterium]
MFNGMMSFFASLGFAILFNIRKEKMIYAAFIGMIGGVLYYMVMNYGYSEVFALFISSAVVSLLSDIAARVLKCPQTTFLICALIPLVPGGTMYYTVLRLVEGDNLMALNYGLNTIFNACSIVIGCILVSGIMKAYSKIRKYLG